MVFWGDIRRSLIFFLSSHSAAEILASSSSDSAEAIYEKAKGKTPPGCIVVSPLVNVAENPGLKSNHQDPVTN
jgi:hypothetical protein